MWVTLQWIKKEDDKQIIALIVGMWMYYAKDTKTND